MTKFGARLLSAFVKNANKRLFVYRILSDNQFASSAIKSDKIIEKQLYYVHHYLPNPRVVVAWIVGGLGNQMYCYAFGKALESKGYTVIFDAAAGGYSDTYLLNIGGGGGIVIIAIRLNQNPPQISAI